MTKCCFLLLVLSRMANNDAMEALDPFLSIPSNLKFVHSSLSVAASPGKEDGVFVCGRSMIPMGSVLMVEDPLLDISKSCNLNQSATALRFETIAESMALLKRSDMVSRKQLDAMFISADHLRESLRIALSLRRLHESEIKDVARFYSNAMHRHLFCFASKMNHGYPTNVALTNSDIPRITVFATKDLCHGEELQYDYFGILGPKDTATHSLRARMHRINLFGSEPLQRESFRAMIASLQNRRDVGRGLEEMLRSGLILKLFANGYSASLLCLMQRAGTLAFHGEFQGVITKNVSLSLYRAMYHIEAVRVYSRCGIGRETPRWFMGKEYITFCLELQSLNECQ